MRTLCVPEGLLLAPVTASAKMSYAYFITCTIVGWLPVFTRPETVQILYDSWRFLQDNGRLTVHGYVILDNHLHMVASSPDISKEIGDFKSFTARQIVDHLKGTMSRRCSSGSAFSRPATRTIGISRCGRRGAIPSRSRMKR